MRERLPLLVPVACAFAAWWFPDQSSMWLAAFGGALGTLIVAGPALYRDVSPLPMAWLRKQERSDRPVSHTPARATATTAEDGNSTIFSLKRVLWWFNILLCIAAFGILVGSFVGLAMAPENSTLWTQGVIAGMLTLVFFAPLAVFLKPSKRPVASSAADHASDAPKEPKTKQRPADFIPQQSLGALHSDRRADTQDGGRQDNPGRSIWDLPDASSADPPSTARSKETSSSAAQESSSASQSHASASRTDAADQSSKPDVWSPEAWPDFGDVLDDRDVLDDEDVSDVDASTEAEAAPHTNAPNGGPDFSGDRDSVRQPPSDGEKDSVPASTPAADDESSRRSLWSVVDDVPDDAAPSHSETSPALGSEEDSDTSDEDTTPWWLEEEAGSDTSSDDILSDDDASGEWEPDDWPDFDYSV